MDDKFLLPWDYLNNTLPDMLYNSSFLRCPDANCTTDILGPNDPQLEKFQDQSRFWVQRVLVPIIMTVGVVGNTITIVIMTQRRMRSSTNCYLAALAIFDMSYLIFSFLLSFKHYPHIHEPRYRAYWTMWPFLVTLTDASSNCSVWLTVTFTVERYIAVCYPMKGKVICTESRAQKMIAIVSITCFLLTSPTAFEWKIIEVPDSKTNSTIIKADYSELGLHPIYVSVYYWVISVLFIIVPFILLAVFNAFLIRSVHSSKVRRKTMTRRRDTGDSTRQESKITVMLIAVVILFFICQLPTAAILLYTSFHDVTPGGNEQMLLRGLGNILNFLMAINAAGNFVLYCLLSQKYRRTFIQIFCPCLKGKIFRLHSVYQNTLFSTVDNESPSASRRFSVKTTRSVKCGGATESEVAAIMRKVSRDQTSRPRKLSFSNAVAVYGNDDQVKYSSTETGSKRLLRGFRCPWKRQKISSQTNSERVTQFMCFRTANERDVVPLKTLSEEQETYVNTQV